VEIFPTNPFGRACAANAVKVKRLQLDGSHTGLLTILFFVTEQGNPIICDLQIPLPMLHISHPARKNSSNNLVISRSHSI
jgi:phosphopantetheinyl transferase